MNVLFTVLVTFFAGMGAGLGTGFAGMSAAAVITIRRLPVRHIPPLGALRHARAGRMGDDQPQPQLPGVRKARGRILPLEIRRGRMGRGFPPSGSALRLLHDAPSRRILDVPHIGYNCVVPVPASSRVRGYNVPERMARSVARAVGVPLEPKLLVRARSGKRQEGLSFDERLVNVSGAFRVTDPERVAGKRILLVDDVS